MKYTSKMLGAASVFALFALGAAPAYAAGTTAGSTILNTVSVNFNVGGVAQTAGTASNSVTVDRKVNITMTTAAATTAVSPGQAAAVTAFTVTNASNDVIDIGLSAINQAGGSAQHGGTDIFDVSNVKYYVMPGNSATYNAATAVQVTYLDEVATDTPMNVFVVSDVPISATNGQVSGLVFTTTAQLGGTATTQGAVLTATAGANTAGVDTVFADGAGSTDAANDGKYSIKGDYTVSAAVLSVTKASTLISDPVNGTTNPKAIPGAVMEYCITVSNASGAATATNLAISDPLPGSTGYLATFAMLTNGSTCTTSAVDGTSTGTAYSATPVPTVSAPMANLTAGNSATFRFRVTIN